MLGKTRYEKFLLSRKRSSNEPNVIQSAWSLAQLFAQHFQLELWQVSDSEYLPNIYWTFTECIRILDIAELQHNYSWQLNITKFHKFSSRLFQLININYHFRLISIGFDVGSVFFLLAKWDIMRLLMESKFSDLGLYFERSYFMVLNKNRNVIMSLMLRASRLSFKDVLWVLFVVFGNFNEILGTGTYYWNGCFKSYFM